jgi:mono/diheme cytochrome c family protein
LVFLGTKVELRSGALFLESIMKVFTSGFKLALLVALLVVGACAQPDSGADSASGSQAKLDMSKGPNKVTADDYALQPVASGDAPLASVAADGKVAPFGMASRAKRELKVATAEVAAAAAPASASAVYAANCIACHGADAKGVQGLGLDLTASQLVAESSAAELVEFLKVGRMPTDPASVTGIPMPGFAWLQSADLDEVARYLKGL